MKIELTAGLNIYIIAIAIIVITLAAYFLFIKKRRKNAQIVSEAPFNLREKLAKTKNGFIGKLVAIIKIGHLQITL